MVKPYNVDDLIRTIKENLQKQKDEERYSEEKVKEYIETRSKEVG
jgi:glutamyl-tRNA reductase